MISKSNIYEIISINSLNYSLIVNLSLKFILFFFIIAEIISFSFYFFNLFPQFNIPNIISSGIAGFLILTYLTKSRASSKFIDGSQIFILTSVVLWVTAELLYGYYDGILKIDAYPSLADLFYLSGYAMFISSLILINKMYKVELSFIVSSIVTFSLIVFYIVYISIFIFDVFDYGGAIQDLVLLFTYPIADLLIIVVAIMYYFRGRSISLYKEHTYWVFISIFAFFFFAADLTFGYNDLSSIESNEYLFDFYYSLGYSFLGIAILFRLKDIQTPKNY